MGNNRKAIGCLCLDGFQHLIHHVQIQLPDQPRVFQRRDKISRGQKTLVRINPPGQCFHITGLSVDRPDDRLQIDLYPFFRNSPVDVFYDILFIIGVLAHLPAVILYSGFIPAFQRGAG